MEQTDSRKAHHHTILVAGLNDIVIANGSARLGNVFHTALMGTLDIVPEWEESI